jgi:hypothetical protein
MRTSKILVSCLLLGQALPVSVATAQEPSSLESAFSREAGLLDEEIAAYGRARAREKRAAADLERLNTRLDQLIEDPNASLSNFFPLEEEIAVATENACQRSRESAAARQLMYERMRTLSTMVREYEQQQARGGGIAGVWRIEARPIDLYGIFDLRAEDPVITGTYRLSNGNQGSVRGTLVGDRLELEMLDSRRGAVATVKGQFHADKAEIRGTWFAYDLSSGQPSSGDWFGSKTDE